MSSIKQTVDSYYNAWRFIENYLPNYSKRDDVLEDDILLRFIEGDDLSKDDMKWIDSEFHGDKKMISDELVRLETGFMEEALRVYYNMKSQRCKKNKNIVSEGEMRFDDKSFMKIELNIFLSY
ncbi:MAG: hypothetical protein K6A94_02980 [Bacteroidales bacterium]|nr:hypothetical protein [Bacteroidales bacterium]